jgi:hypothetical protein
MTKEFEHGEKCTRSTLTDPPGNYINVDEVEHRQRKQRNTQKTGFKPNFENSPHGDCHR